MMRSKRRTSFLNVARSVESSKFVAPSRFASACLLVEVESSVTSAPKRLASEAPASRAARSFSAAARKLQGRPGRQISYVMTQAGPEPAAAADPRLDVVGLARELLAGRIRDGQTVLVDVNDDDPGALVVRPVDQGVPLTV